MKILINGNLTEIEEDITIAVLVEKLGHKQSNVAVEINRVLCPRSKYNETKIGNEMSIEIVAFVGGG